MDNHISEEVKPEEKNDKVKTSKNLSMFLIGFAGLLGVVLILVLGVGLYRVYVKTASDGFTRVVATVFRLPAVKVSGRAVSYANYLDDMDAIRTLQEYNRQQGADETQLLTEEQMSDQVLWRLVNNILLDKAALTFGVKVEDKDVAEVKNEIASQFPDAAEADKAIEERYGWTLDVYADKVIAPYLVQQKLMEKIEADPSLVEAARSRAKEALAKVQAGDDFAQVAQEYSEDPGSKVNGGDLGWFGKGEMVPQFEVAAFALKPGEITQELVESPYGYHIIKVEDKKTETEKDENGKNVEAEKVSARHILIRFPSIDNYMDNLARSSNIRLFLKVHDPFAALKSE